MNKNQNIAMGISLAVVAVMVGSAEIFGEKEIIFPEITAVAMGALIAPVQSWNTSRTRLFAAIVSAAVAGVCIVRFIPEILILRIALGLLVAVSVITLSKTSFVPAISACILPILMGTKSPVYVISVAVMTAFILIFQKVLEYFGLHEKYEYRPIEPSSELLKLRAKQVITVLVICILPVHFHEIFFIAPPLIVAFFELSGKGSKLMNRKYTAIALMAAAAFAGVMARFFISEKLGLSLTFGAVLSSAVIFVICRKAKLYFPPCCAISTLPFMIPKTAIIKFPFEVTAGYIVLTIAAVIITKIDNNTN